MLESQGEVHNAVMAIGSDLRYNLNTQFKTTNNTLNGIRDYLSHLQTKLKNEVSGNGASGTRDTMLDNNQIQNMHYLDCLAAFIGSGDYEAALRVHERRQSSPLRSVYL